MTDRWFSFLTWLAVIAMPIATLIIVDLGKSRRQRSRMKQLSNEWLYQHRGGRAA